MTTVSGITVRLARAAGLGVHVVVGEHVVSLAQAGSFADVLTSLGHADVAATVLRAAAAGERARTVQDEGVAVAPASPAPARAHARWTAVEYADRFLGVTAYS